jgi:Flp pilus assembly protein TadD
MALADEAFAAKRRGDTEQAKELFQQALTYERDACELVAPDFSAEPTRSVLHRSAASLALAWGELREAERLIAIALTGNPPAEIAEELRDLLQQVYKDFRKAPVPATV